MGLFTNRKREENHADLTGHDDGAEMLAQFAPDTDEQVADEQVVDESPVGPGWFSDVSFDDVPVDAVPFSDEPVDPVAFGDVPSSTTSFDTIADVPPAPKRRLDDRPLAQAGNVEIDAAGLLEMLGVDDSATLIDISEARRRFLASHQPSDSDDADAAEIKEKIRREVNTAYASFRLTHAS